MQKYIAVINPRMDDDEISHLIAKDIAGALFSISHDNYSLANKLIRQVQQLSQDHHRPISLIQDISGMSDPLDLEFGMKSGADWVLTDQEEHLKMAKGLNKLAQVIYKGRDIPKGIRVDSVMADSFLDPDAQVLGVDKGQIKHLVSEHTNQKVLDTILDIAHHAGSSAVAVSDLELAKALSFRRPTKKIFYAPEDRAMASRAGIYWGVHPVYRGHDLVTSLKTGNHAKKGERVVDASDTRHVNIHLIP